MTEETTPQQIADHNAGKAAELLEIAGVCNEVLKRKIRKLIYYTADDVETLLKGKKGEGNGNKIF